MKQTRVLLNCLICKKEFWKNLCRIKIGKGKYCSNKCYGVSKIGKVPWNKGKFGLTSPFKGKRRPELAGKNHWNWQGGISKTARLDSIEWDMTRARVYQRDKWTCRICGEFCIRSIQCHHLIPWRISHDDSLENLITLCKACHLSVEKNLKRLGDTIYV